MCGYLEGRFGARDRGGARPGRRTGHEEQRHELMRSTGHRRPQYPPVLCNRRGKSVVRPYGDGLAGYEGNPDVTLGFVGPKAARLMSRAEVVGCGEPE